MDYHQYLASTSASADDILADWRWLVGSELTVWHITKAGDALLRNPADGSIHFLDVINGKVERIAEHESDFEAAVRTPEKAAAWLMPELVDSTAALGVRPGNDECLSSKHPPALGGTMDPDNFETCSVLVHFSVNGQLLGQIKDLPPGTEIGEVKIVEPAGKNRRPWWKFW